MASTDDDFKLRVQKIFGSLRSSATSPLDKRPPLWSLTGDEVEKKEWRRDDVSSGRDEMPCSSSFGDFLKEDRKYRTDRRKDDLDDDGDAEPMRGVNGGGEDDDWDLKSSIGLDKTLDNEEEEDEYDKVASGRDYTGKVFMGDITDHGPYLNSENVLQDSDDHSANKDRRANYMAARMRLKEDDDEAQINYVHSGGDTENEKTHSKTPDERIPLRPILKRNDRNEGGKPPKRVRFDPAVENNSEDVPEKFEEFPLDTASRNVEGVSLAVDAPRVPDYMVNPSKYTRYSFDSSSEVDEESNTIACMDFLKLAKELKSRESETGSELMDTQSDLPKVTFIPKKKANDVEAENNGGEVGDRKDKANQSSLNNGLAQVLAAGQAELVEEVDTDTETSASVQKGGRSYRTKSRSDDTDT